MDSPNGEYGGEVIRSFYFKGERLSVGTIIEVEEAMELPAKNRRALAAVGKVRWYDQPAPVTEHLKIHTGNGKYHVYEGVRLTIDPVDKDTADAMVVSAAGASDAQEA